MVPDSDDDDEFSSRASTSSGRAARGSTKRKAPARTSTPRGRGAQRKGAIFDDSDDEDIPVMKKRR